GELDVVLDVRFRGLGGIEHAVGRAVGPLGANVADLLVHSTHDFPAALFQNPLQLGVAVPIHLSARSFLDAHMIALLLSPARTRVISRRPLCNGFASNEIPTVYTRSGVLRKPSVDRVLEGREVGKNA